MNTLTLSCLTFLTGIRLAIGILFQEMQTEVVQVTNKRNPHPTSFNIHGHNLEMFESAKYLGVTINKYNH